MRFPRQEYWSGLPFPSPGGLPDPGMEPESPAAPVLAGGLFTAEPPGTPSGYFKESWSPTEWEGLKSPGRAVLLEFGWCEFTWRTWTKFSALDLTKRSLGGHQVRFPSCTVTGACNTHHNQKVTVQILLGRVSASALLTPEAGEFFMVDTVHCRIC